jgi:hypothetical protein
MNTRELINLLILRSCLKYQICDSIQWAGYVVRIGEGKGLQDFDGKP